MSKRTKDLLENEVYHVYNRGVERRDIFVSEDDYLRFTCLLYLCNSHKSINLRDFFNPFFSNRPTILEISNNLALFDTDTKLVDIYAYCLMPNHFHIMLKQVAPSGISKFMQKVCTSYTMYFNTKSDRDGSLFQGKFRSKHIESDAYLKHLFAYIHLNPVKLFEQEWKSSGIRDLVGAENFLNSYSYSSYLDYVDDNYRNIGIILNKKDFLNHYDDIRPRSFRDTVLAWLDSR